MESVASANVDTSKFLSPEDVSRNPEWRTGCSDFALQMLEEGVHADITFNAKGGFVKAHKSVLACVSPVFNAMFKHDKMERLTSTEDIPDMTIDALQLFLLLLYTTNQVSNELMYVPSRQMSHFNAAIDKHFGEIYKVVLKYQVQSRLGFVLISALARNLTPENCWFYYNSAVGGRGPFADRAFTVCEYYVLGNYPDVVESYRFLEEMRRNPSRVHRVIKEAESQDARKAALANFLRIKSLG